MLDVSIIFNVRHYKKTFELKDWDKLTYFSRSLLKQLHFFIDFSQQTVFHLKQHCGKASMIQMIHRKCSLQDTLCSFFDCLHLYPELNTAKLAGYKKCSFSLGEQTIKIQTRLKRSKCKYRQTNKSKWQKWSVCVFIFLTLIHG